jgi:hypothetical protein
MSNPLLPPSVHAALAQLRQTTSLSGHLALPNSRKTRYCIEPTGQVAKDRAVYALALISSLSWRPLAGPLVSNEAYCP